MCRPRLYGQVDAVPISLQTSNDWPENPRIRFVFQGLFIEGFGLCVRDWSYFLNYGYTTFQLNLYPGRILENRRHFDVNIASAEASVRASVLDIEVWLQGAKNPEPEIRPDTSRHKRNYSYE